MMVGTHKGNGSNTRYMVKKFYQAISNPNRPLEPLSIQWRIESIRKIEDLLKTQFVNSRDMRRKIEEHLKHFSFRRGSAGWRIKKARRKKKFTQLQLAEELGYKSRVPIAQFEADLRYPPDRVFVWLEAEGM